MADKSGNRRPANVMIRNPGGWNIRAITLSSVDVFQFMFDGQPEISISLWTGGTLSHHLIKSPENSFISTIYDIFNIMICWIILVRMTMLSVYAISLGFDQALSHSHQTALSHKSRNSKVAFVLSPQNSTKLGHFDCIYQFRITSWPPFAARPRSPDIIWKPTERSIQFWLLAWSILTPNFTETRHMPASTPRVCLREGNSLLSLTLAMAEAP